VVFLCAALSKTNNLTHNRVTDRNLVVIRSTYRIRFRLGGGALGYAFRKARK
jgi:hypothetical protein